MKSQRLQFRLKADDIDRGDSLKTKTYLHIFISYSVLISSVLTFKNPPFSDCEKSDVYNSHKKEMKLTKFLFFYLKNFGGPKMYKNPPKGNKIIKFLSFF